MPRKLHLDFHPAPATDGFPETSWKALVQKRQCLFDNEFDDVHTKTVRLNGIFVKSGISDRNNSPKDWRAGLMEGEFYEHDAILKKGEAFGFGVEAAHFNDFRAGHRIELLSESGSHEQPRICSEG